MMRTTLHVLFQKKGKADLSCPSCQKGKDGLCEKPKVHCSALPRSRLYTKSLEETSKNYWKSQRQKHPLCVGAESKLPRVRLRGS